MSEFTLAGQELYLRFMKAVRGAGTFFAFPVRTVRPLDLRGGELEGPGAAARAPRSGGADRDRTDDL